MKYLLALTILGFLTACDPSPKKETASPAETDLAAKDMPLLPIKKGDVWEYDVRLEIPAGISSPEAPAVDSKFHRTRTYIGKIVPGQGLPETDCFEVANPSTPVEREFVEIYDDRILMRGSMILRNESSRPIWLEKPFPFVIAGMKAGTSSPEIRLTEGVRSRKIQVVAREEASVPGGKFATIRLLMSGMDGPLELHRTIWFSPGIGIVREESTRYNGSKLVYRETQEMVSTSVTRH